MGLLRSYDPGAVADGTLDLDDPYYGGATDFDRCVDQVERACRGLVDSLAERFASAPAVPADA